MADPEPASRYRGIRLIWFRVSMPIFGASALSYAITVAFLGNRPEQWAFNVCLAAMIIMLLSLFMMWSLGFAINY